MASLAALAQAPRADAHDQNALVGGTVVDALKGAPIRDGVILVEDGRITAVGSMDTLEPPEGHHVISTEGMTVLPGLWDMHVHLMITGHADYAHWHPTYKDRFATEIMPASAEQLLLAGITAARDLGAPLEDSVKVKKGLADGDIHGPRVFFSGPFIQHEPYPGTEAYRWGVDGPEDARTKVTTIADAGMDIIKLIDQDEMTEAEIEAVIETAHARGLPVVGHSHRPDEIRLGLKYGVDNFEHTGLATAPEYPADVMAAIKERTAQMNRGPFFWTPTVEGLWNYTYVRENNEHLDKDCWKRGLKPDTIADIQASIQKPERLGYFQITPARQPTLKRKVHQLRDAGVVLLIGTDSGIPLKFHCQSTWNEIDVWTRVMDIPVMEAIRAATYWPAVMMGVDADMGSLTEGKFADIIAVEGDVLRYPALLQRVDFVMKGGVIYKQDGEPVEAALKRGGDWAAAAADE
ncbi:MAG: amidohydrolase family protein [Maricaulaceae bacterium]